MTFVPPKTQPDSFAWLHAQDPDTVQYLDVIACAHNYVEFFASMGMQAQSVTSFLQPGDLQTLASVVKDWPTMEGAPRKPNVAEILMSIKVTEGYAPMTFAQDLEGQWQRCRKWLADRNFDPDNPNETAKERSNRLAAARMRKYRSKVSEADITDPAEMDLVRALRAAQDNAKAGKAWVRGQEEAAKLAYDAAVAQAKLARSTTVSTAQAHLQIALDNVNQAERALSEYRINK